MTVSEIYVIICSWKNTFFMETSFLFLTIKAHLKAPAEVDVFLYVRRFHGMKLEAIVVEEEVKK